MKMNYVLLGFGIGLSVLGTAILFQSTRSLYRRNQAITIGFFILVFGILVCIVAGWLIERNRHR